MATGEGQTANQKTIVKCILLDNSEHAYCAVSLAMRSVTNYVSRGWSNFGLVTITRTTASSYLGTMPPFHRVMSQGKYHAESIMRWVLLALCATAIVNNLSSQFV